VPAWLERHWGLIILGLFGLTCAIIVIIANRTLPPQHLPWKRLDPALPIGFGTKSQLTRLSLSPSSSCMNMARDIDGYTTIPADPKRPQTGAGKGTCGWDVARVVYGSNDTVLAGEANMQCPLSVASYLWMRELDDLARDKFGAGLSKMHHMGTYSCRRQVGNGSGAWSEHAFANAWDIAGFELSNGTLISVKSDWDGEADKKAFLREARKSACKVFNVTLSPDYNAAHHDHFHVDMGPSRSCR